MRGGGIKGFAGGGGGWGTDWGWVGDEGCDLMHVVCRCVALLLVR